MTPSRRFVLIAFLLLCHGSAEGQTSPSSPETLAARVVAASAEERTALLAREDVATIEVVKVLIALGDKARLAGEFSNALITFQAAEVLARKTGAEPEIGRALNGAADSLFRMTELERAKSVAEESVRFHEQRGDADGLAEAWNTIGNVHFYKGDYPQTLAAGRKTRDLWTSSGNRRGVGRVLNNTGNVYKAMGHFDDALAHYEQALAIFEELGDRRSAGVVTSGIALVHFSRGDYPVAVEYARRGLAISEEAGDRSGIGRGLDSLGNIYRAQGSYMRALDAFHRSLDLRRTLGDKYAMAESENNIGLVHASQGDYQLAIDAYKRALRIASQVGAARALVPETLTNIGTAAWRLGEKERARANFRASLAIAEREKWGTIEGANLYALGQVALEGGRAREAGEMFGRALRIREELKDQAGVAETLNGLAQLSLATRRFGDAIDLTGRAIGLARPYEQAELLWQAQTLRGIAHRRLGQTAAARDTLNDAVAVIERLRSEASARPAGGMRFLETKLSPYHELIELALAEGTAPQALVIAERAKGRVLADLLEGRTSVSTEMTAEDGREERRLRHALRSLNERVLAERTSAKPDDQRIGSLEGERQKIRSEYEAFQVRLYARHPELRLQRGDASFGVDDAAAIVRDATTAVLEYVVADDAAYLFVLARRNGRMALDHYTLKTGRDSLTARVRRLRDRLATRDLLFAQDARDLYDLLLAPAGRSLAGKTHLVIVPDGPLWETPFQALQDGAGRYVIESAAVTHAPSLAVLSEGIRNPRRRSGPPTLLAMGKANFAPSALGPLPEAERQVSLLGSLYGRRGTTYLGSDATESRFKAEASRHQIIHVASHGLFEEGSPLYSSIVLSRAGAPSSDDGLLEAWELLELKLDADLVILSACETGRGRIASGEGIVGTMWALLASGARATIVSQWKVEASSTTELMTALHRRLVRGEGGKAEHLRLASLEVLRTPRYAHPFYWAPFVLVGDPF